MISPKDPQDIINPKPKITSYNCKSSHGTTGFLQGTTYDKHLGRFVCPCGRQYTSSLERPDWIYDNSSGINPLPTERQPQE